VTVLREHHRQQAEERQAAGSAWTASGLVFTTRGANRSTQTLLPR
jgi:hypothetical protein